MENNLTTASSPNSAEGQNVVFTFTDQDDTLGVEVVTQVYPGVTDSSEDKVYNGTYRDGETVTAECRTLGRMVTYTEVKPPISSDAWIRLQTPGEDQYATTVFIRKPEEVPSQLDEC